MREETGGGGGGKRENECLGGEGREGQAGGSREHEGREEKQIIMNWEICERE